MCAKHLPTTIDSHSITHHSLADDMHLRMFATPNKMLTYFYLFSHVHVTSKLGQHNMSTMSNYKIGYLLAT